jgi:tripartite ATP-independent transporter DctP family solute receptor
MQRIRRHTGRLISRREALKLGLLTTSGATAAHLFGIRRLARAAAVEMKLGSDSPAGHPFNIGLEAMKKEIEAKSQGRIAATIYPDAQLGGEEAMTSGLKIGSVDALFASTGVLSSSVPELGIFDLPFLFRDLDQMLRAASGPIGARYKARIESSIGAELIGWGATGSRNMWNSKRAIRAPQDVKGLKMRTQSSRIQQDTYIAFGALPTVVPFVEVYTALQTGVVDGADIGISDIIPLKFYQVMKHMTMTRHFFLNNPFLVSARFLQKLSKEDQEIVREAGRKAVAAEIQADKQIEQSGIAELRQKGIQIIEPEDRAAFIKVAEPVQAKHADRLGGPEFLKAAREA